MRKIDIKDKLRELDVTVEGISLGDFDLIGEVAARKVRSPDDPGYHRFGAFFRPNYERGILLYHLIRSSCARSVLEIGFGRGYGALCAAKAFHDSGIDGQVTSVDPGPAGCRCAEEWHAYQAALFRTFPWASKHVDVRVGFSRDVVPSLPGRWDVVYVDGDHSYEGTRLDWELVKDRWDRHVLFDDYHLPTKDDPGIRCSRAIDEIMPEGFTKELVITDRRLFCDDRGLRDDQVDYGQVLLTKRETTRR
jgi:hypothetical protein